MNLATVEPIAAERPAPVPVTAGPIAIRTQNLARSFGSVQAVHGVSLEVRQGEIFSLLGPNGAGKSTLISILACLLQPTGGDAWVMGHSVTREPMAVKPCLGVVPQEIALYPDLSVDENLRFWGKMYGLRGSKLHERLEAILEIIGLTDRRRDRVGTFSGGMKRRVNIGIALLHRPAVLILDEPTVGIDPQSRRHILDSVKELNRQGATILYTTHYMEEAQELSDRIAIMDQGQVITCGTHAEFVDIVGQKDRIDLTTSGLSERVIELWRLLAGVSQVSAVDDRCTLLVNDSDVVLPRLFESASAQAVRITSVEIHAPNLEAVFLQLTGRALRD